MYEKLNLLHYQRTTVVSVTWVKDIISCTELLLLIDHDTLHGFITISSDRNVGVQKNIR